jgi:eukaryotic-like serine/threonine-protein kinase
VDALLVGDPLKVGRYRLLKRLGAGGMGRVYLGLSPHGRLVAVKLIRPELADDPDFRRRFAHEVQAARRVGGIFTAPVIDADPDAPQPWLVTAYVDGPSLTEAVTAQGPMPLESVLTLAAGLAQGLRAVHAAGVVHRDLKPSNVLLASDGPRIIDFGISRALDSAALTNAGGVVGSPGFMSPEQAEGLVVGPATDVFSLGGLLAYAATGEQPFGMGSPSALLYRVVYGAAATGHVPARLKPLVNRCLAKDPAARPTAAELADELGPVAPADGWPSWHGVIVGLAGDLPPTQADSNPGAAREPATTREPEIARDTGTAGGLGSNGEPAAARGPETVCEPAVASEPTAAPELAAAGQSAVSLAPLPRVSHRRHGGPSRRAARMHSRGRHVVLRGDKPG